MANVLFVCLHNAGRSQISRAMFERAAGDRHTADCAGTTPAEALHPVVLDAMRELDIDLRGRVPQLLTQAHAAWADVVVTMGCGDNCPFVLGTRYIEWDLQDPKDQTLDQVRATRDEIAERVNRLVAELDLDLDADPGARG